MYQYKEMGPLLLGSKCCCTKKFHAVTHGRVPVDSIYWAFFKGSPNQNMKHDIPPK